jgi:hypothetical protein
VQLAPAEPLENLARLVERRHPPMHRHHLLDIELQSIDRVGEVAEVGEGVGRRRQ